MLLSHRDLSWGRAWKEKLQQRGRFPVEEGGSRDTKIGELNTNLLLFHVWIAKPFFFPFYLKKDKSRDLVGEEGGAPVLEQIPQGHLDLLSPCPRLRWPLWPCCPEPRCPQYPMSLGLDVPMSQCPQSLGGGVQFPAGRRGLCVVLLASWKLFLYQNPSNSSVSGSDN